MIFGSMRIVLGFVAIFVLNPVALAQDTLLVYGPGGPAPAMQEAAAAFEKSAGVKVQVTAGPTSKWIGKAKSDADLIFSGSETMMTDFVDVMDGQLDPQQVTSLYLRPLSILVRPGNPKHIDGISDILKSGVKVLVVNGAGQNGVWEDMAGRKGDIRTVVALRRNIVSYAKNSAVAKQDWIDNKDIDVWLIWNIWQVANPKLAQAIPIARDYAIYRDTDIAITRRAENIPSAHAFINFLQSPAGARIFAKWGWKTASR